MRGVGAFVGRRAFTTAPPYARARPRTIDLRSDTVTLPSLGMRDAMRRSAVGDDVKGEDPTVQELEKRVANLLGKEAALYVPTGTMSNLLCVAAHCGRGQEAIVGSLCHIFQWEAGNAAMLGVPLRPVPTNLANAQLDHDALVAALRLSDDPHTSHTRLVTFENTHHMAGACFGPEYPPTVRALLDRHGETKSGRIGMHLDGARLLNAAARFNCTPAELASSFDSISLCLSKGIGAPVGSVLAGSEKFIFWAKRLRKALGGGMRQAGVIAAAALRGLDTAPDRIPQDHANAQLLQQLLAEIDGISIPVPAQTNMVAFKVNHDDLVSSLRAKNILIDQGYGGGLRAVTHSDLTQSDIYEVASTIRSIMSPKTSTPTAYSSAPSLPATHVRTARYDAAKLYLEFGDGATAAYLHIWLRDHCPECINPTSLQREVNTLDIPTNTKPVSCRLNDSANELTIEWDAAITTHHGKTVKTSKFDTAWLRANGYEDWQRNPKKNPGLETALWTKEFKVPRVTAKALKEMGAEGLEGMRQLMVTGALLVEQMTPREQGVAEIAQVFGGVQKTLWGEIWETNVRKGDEVTDTAYSTIELKPHTDNCYLAAQTELQLFSCDRNSGRGGDTWIVDGFAVAEHMRQHHPEAFDFFANVPLAFQSVMVPGVNALNVGKVFELDGWGRVVRVRYNNDDRAVLRYLDSFHIEKFYQFAPILMGLLQSQTHGWATQFKLEPGQMIVVRNSRVLHARRAFEGTERCLVGCYVDQDSFESKLRLLGLMPRGEVGNRIEKDK